VEALVAGREVVGRLLPIAFGLLGMYLYTYICICMYIRKGIYTCIHICICMYGYGYGRPHKSEIQIFNFESSLGLQLTHDAAHYIAAKNHDTKLSLPFFLPSLQIGLYIYICI
jgi:hypothetical protein